MAKRKSTPGRAVRSRARPAFAYQFLIVLPGTDPLVWRRIQVPASYSFWDLHVAIQDAMGWQDAHLHEFVLADPKTRLSIRIGIPDEGVPEEPRCRAGWKVPLEPYFGPGPGTEPVRYRYDFGDDWHHTLELEGTFPKDGGPYPRCLSGAGACPPEDVGGTHGYAAFLRVIRDPRHPERESMLEWAGARFDPHAFDAGAVVFDDPRKRWKTAFEQGANGE